MRGTRIEKLKNIENTKKEKMLKKEKKILEMFFSFLNKHNIGLMYTNSDDGVHVVIDGRDTGSIEFSVPLTQKKDKNEQKI